MPLICCTNVFYQGKLSRHITSPSEKTRPESWPVDYMGKATPVWQLSLSYRCNQPQQTPSVEKFTALYSQHLLDSPSFEFLICILLALKMPLIRCIYVFYQGKLSRHTCYTCNQQCCVCLKSFIRKSGLKTRSIGQYICHNVTLVFSQYVPYILETCYGTSVYTVSSDGLKKHGIETMTDPCFTRQVA